MLAALFAVACASYDVRIGRIPNWMTVPVLVLGLLAGGCPGACAGIVVPLGLWRAGVARPGGGDIKAMAAIGALFGSVGGFVAAIVTMAIAMQGGVRVRAGYALVGGAAVAIALS